MSAELELILKIGAIVLPIGVFVGTMKATSSSTKDNIKGLNESINKSITDLKDDVKRDITSLKEDFKEDIVRIEKKQDKHNNFMKRLAEIEFKTQLLFSKYSKELGIAIDQISHDDEDGDNNEG
jgi:hypothetical protein